MPLFTAVSSSARQLFLLLRCIGFSSKALVQISSKGLRFSVEDSRIVQGLAFLDKSLFTAYHYNVPPSPTSERRNVVLNDEDGTENAEEEEDEEEAITFQISLPALLETLQIFGFADLKDRPSSLPHSFPTSHSAFDTRTLGFSGICRLTYATEGSPLRIELDEQNATTVCSLTTYEAPPDDSDIPFSRDALTLKMIMKASSLHDAISELASTNPARLTITANPTAPVLVLEATGALGEAKVEFGDDPDLLETCVVRRPTKNTYDFERVRNAVKALGVATKVSVRGDVQGVLSLQCMVEMDGGMNPTVSFVDFRFVPFVEGSSDEESGED